MEVCNAEDEGGVFSRVQTGDGRPAGEQRPAADAGGDRGRYLAIDAAELAAGDPWRQANIAGGIAGEFVGAAVVGGRDPPAALFRYSRDRRGEHPRDHLAGFTGILQADAYAGYNELFRASRVPAPVTRALCWAHARRKFFELADVAAQLKRRRKPIVSPMAAEAVKRIDAIFDIERTLIGADADIRRDERRARVAPLVASLERWLRDERAKLARHNPVAGAIDYMLKDWAAFARFLDDGRICLTNNCAERALRGVALGRKAWLFAGSDRGGERAVLMYTLIATARLNDIDPQAWLADVLARIASLPQHQLADLLPWNWRSANTATIALAA